MSDDIPARRHSVDRIALLIADVLATAGGAGAVVVTDTDTFRRWGYLTLGNGQIFKYAVEELDPAEVAAKAAERPGEIGDWRLA